ncbi:MAG TPA: hypothetical protein VL882_21325 [Vicinamibacterales bacterium]|jgi:hypothetical protein|nr:hypothetical protein [Vicinamibacterales bacterium]
MPARTARRALVAVEAARGRDAERGASKVRAALLSKWNDAGAGISHWDASGTFFELQLGNGRKSLTLSPRTLLLLYASDLAFRLRWEIRPAVAAGQIVIAAPYTETAIAFGEAAGLPRKWIVELFRYAPRPDLCLHVKDAKDGAPWRSRAMDGFPEFGAATVSPGQPSRKRSSPRCDQAVEALRRLKRESRCENLRRKTLDRLVKRLRHGKRTASADR